MKRYVVWFGLMVAVALAGCEADCETPKQSASVQINDASFDPPAVEAATVQRSKNPSLFSIELAVTSVGVSALRYNWYYDFDSKSNVPLPFYGACADSPTCTVDVCTKPNADVDTHRLTVVVSDTPLPSGAKTPFDYPEGSHFDSVTWQLSLSGVCP